MTTLNGHFDGKQIVLDDPIPAWLKPNTPVTVTVNGNSQESVLDRIGRLSRPLGLPPDYSEQHDHYTRGTPKR